ncbi:hypothetical protein ABEB36_009449 [Hypothenemus hampei]|uniref:Uncharacterized protein n=1 Tax=Hypothenemus hampei TaxID=57062 RepID=A0ABD1EGC9_HYPHA
METNNIKSDTMNQDGDDSVNNQDYTETENTPLLKKKTRKRLGNCNEWKRNIIKRYQVKIVKELIDTHTYNNM